MRMLLLTFLLFACALAEYQPTWESLESRPLPAWYDDQKFGIFCHWGVYSVPAHRSEWLWWYWKGDKDKEAIQFIEKNYPPGISYADFATNFHAELFDPTEFANVIKSSGAKYFVLTSKHHEGFTMWPSFTSFNWNSVDIGPKKDIVGNLRKSMADAGVTFGVYFSQYDWFHPLYTMDKTYNTTLFSSTVSYPQMIELVNQYKPNIIWSDGDWEQPEEYWRSKEFLAWLYNESPVKNTVVVNDRWGKGVMGKHGGFLTFSDHYDPGTLQNRKWENCFTMDKKSWGFRRDMKQADVQTVYEIVFQLARTVACGGNVLLNVGPDDHGRIPLIFQDRLAELGRFLSSVDEALYGTKPWIYQNDSSETWYTSRYRTLENDNIFNKQLENETIVYAWILKPFATGNQIVLHHVKPLPRTKVFVLGLDRPINFYFRDGLIINTENIPWRKLARSDMLVLKIEHAATHHHNPLKTLRKIQAHKQAYRSNSSTRKHGYNWQ